MKTTFSWKRGGQFYHAPDDPQWLRETALKNLPDVPSFRSFVLYGNEDCPDRVDLYPGRWPLVGDRAIAVYRADAIGNLHKI